MSSIYLVYAIGLHIRIERRRVCVLQYYMHAHLLTKHRFKLFYWFNRRHSKYQLCFVYNDIWHWRIDKANACVGKHQNIFFCVFKHQISSRNVVINYFLFMCFFMYSKLAKSYIPTLILHTRHLYGQILSLFTFVHSLNWIKL